jgi:hypothetical protein
MAQQPIYDAEGEQLLMSRLWAPTIADDPEAFVLFAFPWGQPNTPLAKFKGPRTWQRKILRKIATHIKTNRGRSTWTPCAKRWPPVEASVSPRSLPGSSCGC